MRTHCIMCDVYACIIRGWIHLGVVLVMKLHTYVHRRFIAKQRRVGKGVADCETGAAEWQDDAAPHVHMALVRECVWRGLSVLVCCVNVLCECVV